MGVEAPHIAVLWTRDRDRMDGMDIMDTNGHVLWTEWTRTAGDVLSLS